MTYNTIIDTMEIKIELSNLNDFNKIELEQYGFVKSVRLDIKENKSYVIIALSLNRVKGHYARINGLRAYNKTFVEVMGMFGVVIQEDIKLNRIDIAIDSELKFHDNFKYFLYMFELLSYSDKRADKWYTTNLDTLKNHTIKQLGRNLEIVFYDKECESKGRHLYNTRMEFRYKRLSSLDFEANLIKLVNFIKNIDVNINLLNKNMTVRLCRIYDSEVVTDKVKNLSEFVRKYDNYIYTKSILDGLHKHSSLKGTSKSWLKKYRERNKLELFTKTNVKDYQQKCIKALNLYKKS